MKQTTIKLATETKDRLTSLDIAEKGKTYDMMVNDLITTYQKFTKGYRKDVSKWKKEMKAYEKEKGEYDKEKLMWKRLLAWAKKKGFKG